VLGFQGCALEVVVVDDGSTDSTAAFLKDLVSSSPAVVKVVTLPVNQGLIAALEVGLAACSYEYVARLDADDVALPGRLGRQREFLERNPSVDVVGSQALLFSDSDDDNDDNNSGTTAAADVMVAKGVPTHPVMVGWELLFRCCLLHPSVMYRRSAVLACGSYQGQAGVMRADDEREGSISGSGGIGSASAAEDYSLWLRMAAQRPCSLASVPDVLVRIRKHAHQKSKREQGQLSTQSRTLRLRAVLLLLQNSERDGADADANVLCSADHLDALTNPEVHLLRGEQVEGALALLDRMLHAYLCVSLAHAQHDDRDGSGAHGEEVRALLQASVASKKERLCAAAVQKGLGEHLPAGMAKLRHQAEIRALKARLLGL
jgi:hypothetical protein